jgi:multidrug efflux pump subunit AcrA (membrane-fusion protein)
MLRSTTVCWLLLCLGILATCKDDGAAAASPTHVSVLTTQIVDFAPPGTSVNGTGSMKQQKVVLLPRSALVEIDGRPAVWVLDPGGTIASPRPITISSYTRDQIAVSSGLQTGEIVVKARAQRLHPGQKVQIVNDPGPTGP